MSAAFENYIIHANDQVQREQNVSPATLFSEQESMYTYNYDYRTMCAEGFDNSFLMDLSDMDPSGMMATEQVVDITVNGLDYSIQINPRERPEIKIITEPVCKFRFRYRSEMTGTHGSILGDRGDSSDKKIFPTVKLINYRDKNAVIRCTLVTADEDRRFPHAHHLVRKYGNEDKDDPHDIKVSDECNFTAVFNDMGIIHTAKKDIKKEFFRKKKVQILEEKRRMNVKNPTITEREEIEIKLEEQKARKCMDSNRVALCFQAFYYGENNILYPLTEKMYSRPINNKKSASTGDLKICRMNKHTSSCEGDEDVWLLVDKVDKKNIKVKFYEVDEIGNTIWEGEGKFSELDVHHQFAIVLKTPPYKDVNITEEKKVYLKLQRPSDGENSNIVDFLYKPKDRILNRKRQRTSSSGSLEFVYQNSISISQSEKCMPTLLEINQKIDHTVPLRSDVSNISEELKLLVDGDIVERTLDTVTNSPGLVPDGGDSTEFENSEEDFAEGIVRKVMNIIKATTSESKQETLIKIKELLEETTNYGDSPLHCALSNEEFNTVKNILRILGTDPLLNSIANLQNSSGKTPLHLAVLQNRADFVRKLLKLGADPNLCDEEDATSLHSAVLVNSTDCINELLTSGSKLNLEAHTDAGWSALHLAVKVGSLHAIKALIEAGANVNSTDMSYGRTVLHIAVDNNHKHIVNYLLTKTKIDVNLKNFGGNTALHNAVVGGNAADMIMMLKRHGANPNLRNYNVHTEDEEYKNSATPPTQLTTDSSAFSNSDSEDEEMQSGESSFDLAKNDPKLMQLLREESPNILVEKKRLDRQDESKNEMMLQDLQSKLQAQLIVQNGASSDNDYSNNNQEQKKLISQGDEKLSDDHVKRIVGILDRTGDWERLAQCTNLGYLVKLYKRVTSPAAALFSKIRLQNPDITVSEVKKYLFKVQAYEAASELDKR